ncbi:hypothetical protein F4804DRAFT_223519 [Jackrogersella minutella]|nr:hypothetical protein F4804DRAFT_223519 [Jackrogersella minutella]
MVLVVRFVRLSHQTISFHAINRASKKASRITHPRLNSSTTIRTDLQLLFYAIFSRKRAPLYQLFTRSQPTNLPSHPVGLPDSRFPPRPRSRKKAEFPILTADPHRDSFFF